MNYQMDRQLIIQTLLKQINQNLEEVKNLQHEVIKLGPQYDVYASSTTSQSSHSQIHQDINGNFGHLNHVAQTPQPAPVPKQVSFSDNNISGLTNDMNNMNIKQKDIIVKVDSMTNNQKYKVNVTQGTCTCKAFYYQKQKNFNYICKHMLDVKNRPYKYGLKTHQIKY